MPPVETLYLIKSHGYVKVGRSSMNNNQRISSYHKDREVYLQILCNNSEEAETLLIEKFNKLYTRPKWGREYFDGNPKEMMAEVIKFMIDFSATDINLILPQRENAAGGAAAEPVLSYNYKFINSKEIISDTIYLMNPDDANDQSIFSIGLISQRRRPVGTYMLQIYSSDSIADLNGLTCKLKEYGVPSVCIGLRSASCYKCDMGLIAAIFMMSIKNTLIELPANIPNAIEAQPAEEAAEPEFKFDDPIMAPRRKLQIPMIEQFNPVDLNRWLKLAERKDIPILVYQVNRKSGNSQIRYSNYMAAKTVKEYIQLAGDFGRADLRFDFIRGFVSFPENTK